MLKSLPELLSTVAAEARCVDIHAARSEMASNGGLLIDVREPGEVAARAVPGSQNVPRGVLEMQIPGLAGDPATHLYLHCASGSRCRLAVEQLTRLGYQNVTAISSDIGAICEAFEQG